MASTPDEHAGSLGPTNPGGACEFDHGEQDLSSILLPISRVSNPYVTRQKALSELVFYHCNRLRMNDSGQDAFSFFFEREIIGLEADFACTNGMDRKENETILVGKDYQNSEMSTCSTGINIPCEKTNLDTTGTEEDITGPSLEDTDVRGSKRPLNEHYSENLPSKRRKVSDEFVNPPLVNPVILTNTQDRDTPDSHPTTLLILQLLYEIYGFVPLGRQSQHPTPSTSTPTSTTLPIPNPSLGFKPDQKDMTSLLTMTLGVSSSKDIGPVLASSYVESIKDFLAKMTKSDNAKPEELCGTCDIVKGKWAEVVGVHNLGADNEETDTGLEKEERLSVVKGLGSPKTKLWVFDLGGRDARRIKGRGSGSAQAPKAPRRLLGLANASDVLSLCRLHLDPNADSRGLARELLQRGIHFHFMPETSTNFHCERDKGGNSEDSRKIIKASDLVRRTRVFTKSDYLAYVDRRTALLANPRIRALALLDGGMLWRLAGGRSREGGHGDPGAHLTEGQPGFEDTSGLIWYCSEEDELSRDEIDTICGVYYYEPEPDILHEEGEITPLKEKSWWPLPQTWRNFGLPGAFGWSEHHEEIFLAREGVLERGGRQDSSASRSKTTETQRTKSKNDNSKQFPQPLTSKEWASRLKDNIPWQRKIRRIFRNQCRLAEEFLQHSSLRLEGECTVNVDPRISK